ncbi:hypothetical protein C8J56DRAFT_992678 [Mycena floridula]|nr:hypothetical protein C8J56DRAFT_992678 [Mycena floridula]
MILYTPLWQTHWYSKSIVHGDFKGENILEPYRDLYLRAWFWDELTPSTGTAVAGSLLGCAPELVTGRPTMGPASDIYPLGYVFYEISTKMDRGIVVETSVGGLARSRRLPSHCPGEAPIPPNTDENTEEHHSANNAEQQITAWETVLDAVSSSDTARAQKRRELSAHQTSARVTPGRRIKPIHGPYAMCQESAVKVVLQQYYRSTSEEIPEVYSYFSFFHDTGNFLQRLAKGSNHCRLPPTSKAG